MSSPELIQATASDIPTIRALADRIWHAVYPGIITEEQINFMLDWMYGEEELSRQFSDGYTQFWLFQVGDEVCGFASAHPSRKTRMIRKILPFWNRVWHLSKLYLDPAQHGKGIGSQSLQKILTNLQKRGVKTVGLRVNKANAAAVKCYERNGFQNLRSFQEDIGNGFVMDDFWMETQLS